MITRNLGIASLLVCSSLLVAACGGDGKRARSPESEDLFAETSTEEDMPPPPEKEADPSLTDAVEGPGAAGGMIKLAAMTFTPAKRAKDKAAKSIELKEDGTVLVDGKEAAAIKGDQVDSTGGTSMLTVGVDGSLVGNGVSPGLKFDGDEVVTENGTRLRVEADGTITATTDGKTEPIGKAENGAASPRAALIVAVLWMDLPASATKK